MYFKGVKIYNSKPWRYAQGGRIGIYPDMSPRQINNDSIHIIAQPNELIIPVKHPKFPEKGQLVGKVVGYLKHLGVRLPNT